MICSHVILVKADGTEFCPNCWSEWKPKVSDAAAAIDKKE